MKKKLFKKYKQKSLLQDGADGLQLEWKVQHGRRPRTPSNESGEEDSEEEDDVSADDNLAARSEIHF